MGAQVATVDPELILKTAARVAHFSHVPIHVGYPDAIQAAALGFLQSLRHYDPTRGVKLETFCSYGSRGAIIDLLRMYDPLSRGERKKVKAGKADPVVVYSNEDIRCLKGNEPDFEREGFPDPAAITGQDFAQRSETARHIESAMRRLQPNEYNVLRSIFWRDLSHVETGRRLKISEAGIGNIKFRALRKLRTMLAEKGYGNGRN